MMNNSNKKYVCNTRTGVHLATGKYRKPNYTNRRL